MLGSCAPDLNKGPLFEPIVATGELLSLELDPLTGILGVIAVPANEQLHGPPQRCISEVSLKALKRAAPIGYLGLFTRTEAAAALRVGAR